MGRYSKYIPAILSDFEQFQKLDEVESPVLEEEAGEKERVEQNQWILTSQRDGLLRRVGFMGLPLLAGEGTEALRERVLSYWNRRSPYVYFMVCDWLDSFCGTDGYFSEMRYAEYTLYILLSLREKEKKDTIFEWLRYMIPANILLDLQLDFNTHGKLRKLRHGELKQKRLSHKSIKEVDLPSLFPQYAFVNGYNNRAISHDKR